MSTLKVWGTGATYKGKTHRVVVAATNQKRAVELIRTCHMVMSLHHFRDYASLTGNAYELSVAREEGVWVHEDRLAGAEHLTRLDKKEATPKCPPVKHEYYPALVEPEIASTLSIGAYIHCGKCIDRLPPKTSTREYASLEIGFTKQGVQVQLFLKFLLLPVSLIPSALVAWLAWGPVRAYCFSLIPATVQWAPIGKLLVLVLIGYAGGIGLPLLLAFLGILFWLKVMTL